MSTFSNVPNDCLFSSSQRSLSADTTVFYDACEENIVDDSERPLPKIIMSGIEEDGSQSIKDLNSNPLHFQPAQTERPMTSTIKNPSAKMPLETIPVRSLLKSDFYKDTRKFSFQKSLSYTNKMRHLIETYQSGNIPSELASINEPHDSREEELNFGNDSNVLTRRFRSSLHSEKSSSSSRYYVIDRETGKSFPLPRESHLLPETTPFSKSILKGLHHQESQSGKKISFAASPLVSVDKRSSDEVILNSSCPLLCNSDIQRDSNICNIIDDGTTSIDISEETKTPKLIEQKHITMDNIEDKSPCKILPETPDANQAEENYQAHIESPVILDNKK